ncbi:serine protease DegS/serine protease DegQ [Fluviicoccus keumensis]|uniref:Serine protease DegS/serine protease DegQ n=1 Tax=Fluviicoccus keumensis TaxID=1435465 RepID=A0A4V6MFN9_9GAMM|nr:trypsin-like peptidase domain-containing protein [Fluviicoccus keumensis]RZU35346.1 serine protease DegS/serine protease DegQ [Fluviicoccus keumensis]
MNTHRTRIIFTGTALVIALAGCQPKDKTEKDTPPAQISLSQERPVAIQGNAQGVIASYADTVKIAAPAVVNIYTTETVRQQRHPFMDDPFFKRFFENRGGGDEPSEARAGLGSGVIVSKDGYILTNNHVVNQASQIIVALQDGRKAKAKVIGTDPDSDLAVIRIDLDNLPTLPFKSSPNQVGDVVLAIGNPFGVGQTVTQGIISALGRNGLGINTYEDFIQTDAAINPGNSGGALIDVAGNLVGINSAIYSRSGGSMGIGFAIPAKLAQQVMLEIIQHGQVVRGWLGVEVKQSDGNFNADGSLNNKTPEGVEIAGVVRGGPAAEGGIEPGDIILSVDGQTVNEASQLINRIGTIKPDTRVKILVKRNNREVELAVKVGKRPKAESQPEE